MTIKHSILRGISSILAAITIITLTAGYASAEPPPYLLSLTPSELVIMNEIADLTHEPRLPTGTASVAVTSSGQVTPFDTNGVPIPLSPSRGVLEASWKYTKCVAAVGAAFIPIGKAYKAIKGLGGVVKAAKLLLRAGNKEDFKRVAGNLALDILGVAAIQANCF